MSNNIYDLGYDNFIVKPSIFNTTPQSENTFANGTATQTILSGDMGSNLNMVAGHIQSSNFVTGSTGWQITAEGDAEFNTGTFRGSVTGASIDIGGVDATSFHVDTSGNMWLGNATFASAPFKVSSAGAITATGVTVTGAITTGTGSDIKGDYIDALSVGKLTAGTITSKAITLAISAGTGDTYIASGKTDFTNTQTGFILGMDDSDSDLAKLYMGSSTVYFNWTGSALTVVGGTITGGTIQTVEVGVSSGYGIRLSASSNQLQFLNNTSVLGYLTTDAT
jgi:hypothetical protein